MTHCSRSGSGSHIVSAARAGTGLLLAVVFATGAASMFARQPPTKRLLYLTQTAGFRHDVLPVSHRVVRDLANVSGAFDVTVTEDSSAISGANLRDFDAVLFYTTGELPMDDAQKSALLAFVKAGKGFAGAHSATDTFYEWPEYGAMIGGYFDGHPWHEEVTVRAEARHPATRHLPATFQITDEIYQFKNWSRSGVRVLLSLDPSSVDLSAKGVNRTDRDFALAWTKRYGQGRVFYTALGHRAEVWNDERFQKHLLGGLLWVMGANGS
jgi:type 1 glutamine amidotransferase